MQYKLKETDKTNKTARYTLRLDVNDERQYETICYIERKHQTTKLMNMKASKNGKIDVHLKNSIAYILNSKKLGVANLAGGINCLLSDGELQSGATAN